MLLSLLVWMLSAWAQDQGGPTGQSVTIAVDDRQVKMLAAPQVETAGGVSAQMLDDGEVAGDVAGDGIWFCRIEIPLSDRLEVTITDRGDQVARMELMLPNEPTTHVALRTTPGEHAIVVDLASQAPPSVPEGAGPIPSDVPAVHALPVGAAPEEGGADTILVRVRLDDRAVGRLDRRNPPELVVEQEDGETVRFSDNGAVEGDEPNDGLFMAGVAVQRREYLTFRVLEDGQEMGAVTAFMPSTGEAIVKIRTSDGNPGVVLANESTAAGPTAEQTTTTATGGARVAHVIWVGIVLFAVLFGYLRMVVWRTWVDEVRPMMARMDRFLANQDQDEES